MWNNAITDRPCKDQNELSSLTLQFKDPVQGDEYIVETEERSIENAVFHGSRDLHDGIKMGWFVPVLLLMKSLA